jgi:hypothetical protein
MNNVDDSKNEEHIFCKDLKSISSYKDRIIFKKHTHRINHVDLQKYLLMTSGDDDLIIILDLCQQRYILQYYDIINGTSFCRFLEPITSTRIMYYGNKSFKLFLYEYSRNQILLIVNLLRENLYHLEYNNKSNLLITAQDTKCIVWKLNENNLKPNYEIHESYYAIINDEKRQIVSVSLDKKEYEDHSILSLYSYDNNRDLTIIKERDVNVKIKYKVILMKFFRFKEYNFLIVMSDINIDIIKLDDDNNAFHLNLLKNKELKFTCFEPTFTEEIILGYNNGTVEILNPSWEKEKIKDLVDEKYKNINNINKMKKEVENNEFRHEESVVQIKLSGYYPLYVSIADEMIIYQLKK